MKKIKYEVKWCLSGSKFVSSTTWLKCRTGHVTSKGWLEYKLYDGTTGISAPGNFRTV